MSIKDERTNGFKYTGPGYYMTRDGRKALVSEIKSGGFVGLIFDKDGRMSTYTFCSGPLTHWWYATGRFECNAFYPTCNINQPDRYDLVGPWIEPPKPIELWINVYPEGQFAIFSSHAHALRDYEARPYRYNRHCVHVKEVTGE